MNEEMNLTMDLSRLSKEERDEFKRLMEKGSCENCKNRVWKPKSDEEYFTITSCGTSEKPIWENDNIDNFRWAMGIVFKTREEAEFALEKTIVKTQLERYAKEHNNPKREEWDGEYYYNIAYDADRDDIRIDYHSTFKSESTTYFTSEEIAKNAIKEIGEKRIMKYLFGVDCEVDE